jgi:hypothetical protein
MLVEVQIHSFLTSTLERGKSSASYPRGYTLEKIPPIHAEYDAERAPDPNWEL